jgi:methionyl-tRNA formyltransferase
VNVLFAGTPEFAAAHLEALLGVDGIAVAAVLTQPDRPAGRRRRPRPGAVKTLAVSAGLPVLQPPRLRDPEVLGQLRAFAPDVMVVVAYGLILPQAVLDLPRLGCINVHASLLPRWRGAAPIQRAIEAGDSETGITIMQMDAGLDTGAMLAVRRCPIDASDSAGDLEARLAAIGPPLLLEVLADLPGHQARGRAQDDAAATYAAKIDKAEANLPWELHADGLARRIRAFNPAPGCFSHLGEARIRILGAAVEDRGRNAPAGTILRSDDRGIVVACGSGALRLTTLQFPGGVPLAAAELLRARAQQLAPGRRFTPCPAP